MKKLHKEHLGIKKQLEAELAMIAEQLQAELGTFAFSMEKTQDRVDALVRNYNAHVDVALNLLDDIRDAQAAYRDSRKDAWIQSEQGERFQEWVSAWEADLETIDISLPCLPEELEFNALEILKELPETA